MSALTKPERGFEWPTEVIEFASRHQVAEALEPLSKATWGCSRGCGVSECFWKMTRRFATTGTSSLK